MNFEIFQYGCMYRKNDGKLCQREAIQGYNYCRQHTNALLKKMGRSPLPKASKSKKKNDPFLFYNPMGGQMSYPFGMQNQMINPMGGQMSYPFGMQTQMINPINMMYCQHLLDRKNFPMPLYNIPQFYQPQQQLQPPPQSTPTQLEDGSKLLDDIKLLDDVSKTVIKSNMVIAIKQHSPGMLKGMRNIKDVPVDEIFRIYQQLERTLNVGLMSELEKDIRDQKTSSFGFRF